MERTSSSAGRGEYVYGATGTDLGNFNGGKGIATSAGVMLLLYPFWAAVAMVYFVVARVIGGRVKLPEAGALASVSTWVLFTILMLGFVSPPDALYAAALTLFLAWRHQSNFRRVAHTSRFLRCVRMGVGVF